MKNSLNDATRLQNLMDGLEELILKSSGLTSDLSSNEQLQLEQSMRHIFAASAARAKIATEGQTNVRGVKAKKTKSVVPLAVRMRELALLLRIRPDIEPRLQAVFESSGSVDDTELDQIITDVSKLLPHQDTSDERTKR